MITMKAIRVKKAFRKLQYGRPLTRSELAVVSAKLENHQWPYHVPTKAIASDFYLVQRLFHAFETQELKLLGKAAVEAIREGQAGPRREALNRYLDMAEAAVDELSDVGHARAFGQIGLIVAQAFIWLRADEPVQYFRNYIHAETYADNLASALGRTSAELQAYYRQIIGLKMLAHLVGLKLNSSRSDAYLVWAQGHYDDAINAYGLAKQDDRRSDKDRALITLRLVQCLLDESDEEGDPSPTMLKDWVGMLETALPDLEGEPEQKKLLGLLDELKSQ
jgi:hypothetical protein